MLICSFKVSESIRESKPSTSFCSTFYFSPFLLQTIALRYSLDQTETSKEKITFQRIRFCSRKSKIIDFTHDIQLREVPPKSVAESNKKNMWIRNTMQFLSTRKKNISKTKNQFLEFLFMSSILENEAIQGIFMIGKSCAKNYVSNSSKFFPIISFDSSSVHHSYADNTYSNQQNKFLHDLFKNQL